MTATLIDEAMEYEPPQTKNIADLEIVKTDAEVMTKEYTDSDGNPFSMKVITVEGIDYRVPVSVLKSLKAVLEEKPTLRTFKVKKTGEGVKNTRYTLIPLE